MGLYTAHAKHMLGAPTPYDMRCFYLFPHKHRCGTENWGQQKKKDRGYTFNNIICINQ